jgi:hypothetical protein
VTYFFDNCICFRYAHMLAALDVPVVPLRDVFPQNIKDPDLLRALRGTDYTFVSSEQRMRRNPIEARLLKEARVTAVFLAPFWNKMVFWPQVKWLITRWERIDGFVQGAERGTCAEVKQNGRAMPFQL